MLAGVEISPDMGEDSFNALPALLGSDEVIRETILHHDIAGDWKETTNVIEDKPELFEELKALIAEQNTEGRTAPRPK